MLYDDEIIGMVFLAADIYSAENKNLTGKNVSLSGKYGT